MMVSLLQTALNTALSPIMDDMGITASTVQWLSSGYMLVQGISMLATAFLFRRFKTRPLCLVSMAVIMVGLLMAALAHSFPWLLAGRILQAAGGGALTNMVQVVVLSIFPEHKKGTMMGIFGLATCTGPVLAPALGGIVVDYFGWHMLFWISLAVFALLFVLAFMGMASVLETEKVSLDIASMILCSAGFTGLVIASGNLGNGNLLSPAFLVPGLTGAVGMVVFCRRQLRMARPFMDLRVLKNREYRLAMINGILMYSMMLAFVTMLPMCAQSVLGLTATSAGLVILPGSLIMGAIGLAAGSVYDKIGIRKILVIGGILVLVGVMGAAMLKGDSSLGMAAFVYALFLLGPGILNSPVMTWGMSTLEKSAISQASAMYNSLRTIAGSFGSAIFVAVMTLANRQNEGADGAYGMHISFLSMAVPAAALLTVCMISVRSKKILNEKTSVKKERII